VLEPFQGTAGTGTDEPLGAAAVWTICMREKVSAPVVAGGWTGAGAVPAATPAGTVGSA
jgi:hypothetical protein